PPASPPFPYPTLFRSNLPLGYWLEWLQHWLADRSSALVVLRIPSLLCLAATWVLCRWILARVLSSRSSSRSAPMWALAAMFVVRSEEHTSELQSRFDL